MATKNLGKATRKLMAKFTYEVLAVANSDEADDVNWATLISAMTLYTKKKIRKMSPTEIADAISGVISTLSPKTTLSQHVLGGAVSFALTIQEDVFQSKWCGFRSGKVSTTPRVRRHMLPAPVGNTAVVVVKEDDMV